MITIFPFIYTEKISHERVQKVDKETREETKKQEQI